MIKDHYDVEAKPPDPDGRYPAYNTHHSNFSFDDPTLRTMLQALLSDRFQLRGNVVLKKGHIYLLERGGGVIGLTPSKNPNNSGGFSGIGVARGLRLNNITMPQLAEFLSENIVSSTVVDKTELGGEYDFQSKMLPATEDLQGMVSIASLVLAGINEMGLILKRSSGPVTTFAIEQAAHPSPN